MRTSAFAFLLSLGAVALPVSASPVSFDTWYEIGVMPGGAGAQLGVCPSCGTANNAGDPPWTFSGTAFLTVTDLFMAGDSYDVYDNGLLVGTTPAVSSTSAFCQTGDSCIASGVHSYSTFSLGPGSHSLTIFTDIANPLYSDQEAAFRLTATPEPATSSLLGGALLGLLLMRRRTATRSRF